MTNEYRMTTTPCCQCLSGFRLIWFMSREIPINVLDIGPGQSLSSFCQTDICALHAKLDQSIKTPTVPLAGLEVSATPRIR